MVICKLRLLLTEFLLLQHARLTERDRMRELPLTYQQGQPPIFLLHYISWRGVPHYTIILCGFSAEGPNCRIRVFLLIGIAVWGQEHHHQIQVKNTSTDHVSRGWVEKPLAAGRKQMTSDGFTVRQDAPALCRWMAFSSTWLRLVRSRSVLIV